MTSFVVISQRSLPVSVSYRSSSPGFEPVPGRRRRFFSKAYGSEGFSLLEVLMVAAIMGVLIAIALPLFLAASSRAKDQAAEVELTFGVKAERIYYTANDTFAEDSSELGGEVVGVAFTTEAPEVGEVSVFVVPDTDGRSVIVGSRSAAKACFYVRLDRAFEFGSGASAPPPCDPSAPGVVWAPS